MNAAPNLSDFDILLLNTSAGKDSQAMLDYVYELASDAGVTDRLVAVHADLGRVEWPGTAELAAEQAAHYSIRFELVRREITTERGRERQDLLAHIEARGKFPDAARRYCTSDHKRGPVQTLMTRLTAEKRAASVWTSGHQGQVRLLNIMGLRAEESPARLKKIPFAQDARATNGRRDVWLWLPIHDWTEPQVWQRIARAGTRVHSAYTEHGMPRLSCRFCILASRSALVSSARANPDLATEYAELEERLGHRFRNDLSMRQIIEAARLEPAAAVIEKWSA